MSDFKEFKLAIQAQLQHMVSSASVLFLTNVERDALWEKYLSSFPEGTNHVYKERREYDCNTCKQFIRPYGNLVAIIDGKLVTIWDVTVPYPYQDVATAMADFVRSKEIGNVFVTPFLDLGTDKNFQKNEQDSSVITWEHFYFKLPKAFQYSGSESVEAVQGAHRTTKEVFKRALSEITMDAISTTLELIQQNSLYRGEEHKATVEKFLTAKQQYDDLATDEAKDHYAWLGTVSKPHSITHVRNTSIGTLLVAISTGTELDEAVGAFERIMAPANYKRPTALFTKKMVEQAENTVKELGLETALGRRYAMLDDITINNVLFANRDTKKMMGVFDALKGEDAVNIKAFNKVEEVTIDNFLKEILPSSSKIELLLENGHTGNLMSLIAPQDKTALPLFKWQNGFSWAYNGDMTDSMKERVKAAGGKVDGILRFSIQWNDDGNDNIDFDAHAVEPDGNHIYFSSSSRAPGRSSMSGQLDVDITNPGTSVAVENITWSDFTKMKDGTYKFSVHNYSSRKSNAGFSAEIEYGGVIHSFVRKEALRGGETVEVAIVEFSKKEGISFTRSMEFTIASKELWNMQTNNFQNVSAIMFSPNYWDDRVVGNKHYFFMLENAKNAGTPRGFFNEFLTEDLAKHRKVFEAMGNKMRVAPSENQLSGLGFSSTQKHTVVCRVTGAFSRVVKIIF